jgi:hypothetical protein
MLDTNEASPKKVGKVKETIEEVKRTDKVDEEVPTLMIPMREKKEEGATRPREKEDSLAGSLGENVDDPDVSFGENSDPFEGIGYINDEVEQRAREGGDSDEFLRWFRNDWNSRAEKTVKRRVLQCAIQKRKVEKGLREIQERQMENELNPLVRCVSAPLFKRRQIEQQRQTADESAMALLMLSFGLLSQLERLSVLLEVEGIQQQLLLVTQSNNERKEPSNERKKPMVEVLSVFTRERNGLHILRRRVQTLYEEIERNASKHVESAQAVFKPFDAGVLLQTKKSTAMPTQQQLISEVERERPEFKGLRQILKLERPWDSKAPEFKFPPIPCTHSNTNTPEELFLLESRLVSDVRFVVTLWRARKIRQESDEKRKFAEVQEVFLKFMSPTNKRAPRIVFDTSERTGGSSDTCSEFLRRLDAKRLDTAETITAGVFKALLAALNKYHGGNLFRAQVDPLSDLRASKSVLMQLLDDRLPSNLKCGKRMKIACRSS